MCVHNEAAAEANSMMTDDDGAIPTEAHGGKGTFVKAIQLTSCWADFLSPLPVSKNCMPRTAKQSLQNPTEVPHMETCCVRLSCTISILAICHSSTRSPPGLVTGHRLCGHALSSQKVAMINNIGIK